MEPPRGLIEEPSPADLSLLNEAINIQAPDPWATTYRKLLYRHQDVISKGKFNLGWADIVEHKINLTDDDPVHVRQFRIPLEYRPTIYNWVDELLKKGEIAVSRSTYNLPIFLVQKLHGQGMRTVLDYCTVNLKSKPDRYTIREIRDCIDEIGLAESNTSE